MGLTENQQQAARDLHDMEFIVMPGKLKRPWYRGWQQLEASVDDLAKWNQATCFSILTGKKSGLTVIDVDAPDREWFDDFWVKLDLPPTTTVETPSGGLHLYYKYDARLKQTQGLGKLAIDVRNDGGQIVAPGSPYDTDKKEKMKFNGIEYKFATREGDELDWEFLRELDDIWVQIQDNGIDKETGLICSQPCVRKPEPAAAPKKNKKVFGVLDYDYDNECMKAEPRKITPEQFMSLMLKYSKENPGYEAWYKGVWSWCKVAEENDFDAFKWADRWSEQIDSYDGSEKVLAKVREYSKVSNNFGYDFIIGQLPERAKSKTVRKFLKETSKKYYYNDLNLLMRKRDTKTKWLPMEVVDDYLRTALICVNSAGRLEFYLRERAPMGRDAWVHCNNKCGPFAAAQLKGCPFSRRVPPSEKERELAKEENRQPRVEFDMISIRKRYDELFYELGMYDSIVFRQYYGKESPCTMLQYNMFSGYQASIIDEKQPEEVYEGLALVEDCWLTMMCNGNRELYDYVLNWQAWLMRHGHQKIETFLVFISKEGAGKNTLWERFFLDGVLGRQNGHVVTDLKRFLEKFNHQRLYKALHIFNECNSQLGTKKHDSDKLKALTDRYVTVEPKGRERFVAEDTAGCVFLSNHNNPVRLGNSDRRYVVADMGEKYIGDREYWTRLNTIIKDQRVCDLYFTKLMARDVEKWNQRDIPKTARRTKLKEANWENHFIHYLVDVVQGGNEEYAGWYKEVPALKNGAKQCYFTKKTVMDHFLIYMKENNLNRSYFNFFAIKDNMMVEELHSGERDTTKLRIARVTARGSMATSKHPTKCLLIDKEEVRNLYRAVLNEPDWDYPKRAAATPEIEIQDREPYIVDRTSYRLF